jgi:uncharacterized membrane protein
MLVLLGIAVVVFGFVVRANPLLVVMAEIGRASCRERVS